MSEVDHEKCVMLEKWATLDETLKHWEESRIKEAKNIYEHLQTMIISQAKVNAAHAESISKLMQRIYGNTEEGLTTTVKLNKATAASEIGRIEGILDRFSDRINRLWFGIGLIIIALIGNIIAIIKIKP